MSFKIRDITLIAIFSALGCVLDIIGTVICASWGNGFAINLSMITITILSLKEGWFKGIITGLITGLLEMIFASMLGGIIDLLQGFIEYPLALLIFGLVGISSKGFKEKKSYKFLILLFVCTILKIMLHAVCGVIYWKIDFPVSLLYNAIFILVSFVICSLVIIAINKRFNKIFD